MTAYCMAFSKCCRKLAKWGSGYVLISYPRIRKKCIQERIQSLLTTDYIQTTTDTELYFEYFLLTYRLQQLQWLSSRSCWAKNIFAKPRIKLIRGLYVFSIQICIFYMYCISVLLCILNIFSLTAPATKVTFQQEQLPTGHQVNVSCSAKNIFPQPRIKLTWGLL